MSTDDIAQAARYWAAGLDTAAIAERLNRPEAQIYNSLAAIKTMRAISEDTQAQRPLILARQRAAR